MEITLIWIIGFIAGMIGGSFMYLVLPKSYNEDDRTWMEYAQRNLNARMSDLTVRVEELEQASGLPQKSDKNGVVNLLLDHLDLEIEEGRRLVKKKK